MVYIYEALDGAKVDKSLLAIHFNIVQELFVCNSQNVNYGFNIVLIAFAESEFTAVQVAHDLLKYLVTNVRDWNDLLTL